MRKVIYIYKGVYPWDVRADKITRKLVESGFEVYILSRYSDNLPERETIYNVQIIRVGAGNSFALSQPVSYNPIWKKALKRLTSEIKPDLIIARDIMLAELASDVGRKQDIPVLMDMAEHYPAVMKGWRKYKERLLFKILVHDLKIPELVEKRSVRLMDGIITVCDEQKFRLNNEYKYNLDNIEVIHNTPDIKIFENVEKGFQQPPINLCYHGYVNNERNMFSLLNAFISAHKTNESLRLTIAGSGEDLNDLKKLTRQAGIEESVEFTGEYKFSDLVELYSKTDIAILPYKVNLHINNTISNKLFDYFACGKPVIVSKATPMIRLIKETNAGIVSDCDNPENLAKAITGMSNMDLKSMSENGMKAAKDKYNWEIDSDKLIKFINKF